jgi:hypothetical protein
MLTEGTYLEANRLNYWLRLKTSKVLRIWGIANLTALFVSIGCAFIFADQPSTRSTFEAISAVLAFWAVGALILGCISYLMLPRSTKKLLAQQKLFREFQNYEAADESFNMTSTYSDTRLPYHMAFKWAENDKVFLIYHSVMTFNIISKEAAEPSAIDYLRSKLQDAGIEGFSL